MALAEDRLAIEGGAPQRRTLLPYGRQDVDDADIAAVTEVLRSDYLTTGPAVEAFESAFAAAAGARHAVAVCNGTAALHAAAHAAGLGPEDEAIVPAMTFAASANCVLYQGARPVFADVDPDTLLLTPRSAAARITRRTRAIVAVDYAGQPCDYGGLRELAKEHGLALIADASHSVGGAWDGQPVGSLADLTTFSFHPVKLMTTAEGGMITTNDDAWAQRMRVFRNHGITSDHRQRAQQGSFFYEMVDLGFNYRLSDVHCALGQSQLRRLPAFVERRRAIAARYSAAFADVAELRPLHVAPPARHVYHLYPVLLHLERLTVDRAQVHAALRAEGIGANVHYIPVHLHPYYRERLGTHAGQCPVAEDAYERLLTLPIFPAMSDGDADDVIRAVTRVLRRYRR